MTVAPINAMELVRRIDGSDGEVILRGHLVVEAMLLDAIASHPHIVRPDLLDLDRVSFPGKLSLAAALGVLGPDDLPGLLALNRLRNRLAHKLDFEATDSDVWSLRNALSPAHQNALNELEGTESFPEITLQVIVAYTAFTLAAAGDRMKKERAGWAEVARRLHELGLDRRDRTAPSG